MKVRGRSGARRVGRSEGLQQPAADVQSDAGLAEVIDLTNELGQAAELTDVLDLDLTGTEDALMAPPVQLEAPDLEELAGIEAGDLVEVTGPAEGVETLEETGFGPPIPISESSEWLNHSHPVVRERILGYRVDVLGLESAIEMIVRRARIRAGGGSYVCCSNVHATVEGRENPELRQAADGAFLSVPDGMPLAWILKRRGHDSERVSGMELAQGVTADGVPHGLRHFFLGGAPGVPEKVAAALQVQAPGMQVAGCYSPPFAADGGTVVVELKNMIAETQPDVLWVALGCPKQEMWMARNASVLGVPVMLGIGAAFDFLSGEKKRAPQWMQERGLEWLFRLLCEPRRLWRRYLIGNSKFVRLLLAERFSRTAKYQRSSET